MWKGGEAEAGIRDADSLAFLAEHAACYVKKAWVNMLTGDLLGSVSAEGEYKLVDFAHCVPSWLAVKPPLTSQPL